jgi:hypothetical protein
MTASELRELCLGLPGAREEFPFRPQLSVFKVGQRTSELATRLLRPRVSSVSITNALARLEVEEQRDGQPSIYGLRRGTLILEPESGPGPEHSYRLMLRLTILGRAGPVPRAASDNSPSA